jgi:hypothetical protein
VALSIATKHAIKKLNMTEEDWKTYKSLWPKYAKRGMVLLLPWRDKNDELRVMDLTWMLPFGFWMELGAGMFHAIKDQDMSEIMPLFAKQIGHPFATIYAGMTTGVDPYTGTKLWDEDWAAEDKTHAQVDFVLKTASFAWFPSMTEYFRGGWDFERTMKLMRQEKDYYTGKTQDWRYEIPNMIGIVTKPMGFERVKKKLQIETKQKIKEQIKKKISTRTKFKLRKIDAAERDKRMRAADREIERLRKQFRLINQVNIS